MTNRVADGMKRFSFNAYLNMVVKTPGWVLLCCAAITFFFAWHLPGLSFKTTVYDLVIEDLDESDRYNQFLTQFGSDEIIRLVVKARDILDPATFSKITQLSEAAAQIDGVIRIISLPEVRKSVDRSNEWDMAEFAAMLVPVELFQSNLISADRKTTIITLVLDAEADKDAAIAAVRQLFKTTGKNLRLYQTGMPLVSEALAEYTRQDFFHLTPITLIIIAVLLVGLFRNLHCLILPLSCVMLAVLWTFGLMALSGISVSMLTIIVPVFLIAVGTAYCLHIYTEYLQQIKASPSNRTASRATFGRMAFPVTLAVATTLIGIGSLGANRIAAIQEFALFACFGMASLLVIVLTFFPAMLAWLPAPRTNAAGASAIDRFFDGVMAGIITLNLKHRKTCLIAIGLVSVVCAAGIFRIRVETNPVAFFKRNTNVSMHFHDIYQDMSGSFPINVVMAGTEADYFEIPANVAGIARLQTFLDQLPGVDKTISLADYLKLVNYVYNRFDPQFYVLPEDSYELRMLMNNFKIILGNDLLQRFMGADYSRVNILMLTHIANSRDFIHTRDRILAHAKTAFDDDVTLDVTGLGMVIAASSHLLTLGQVKSLAISLALIFAVMVVLFVSSKVGLIAVVPNLFPIVVNFGLMGLLGIPLSVATSLIASVAIGLVVDDTIHYLVRYNTEFKRDLDKDRAMRDTLMNVGRPIIFTSLTISLGFSVLIFSHFQPTAIFGFLMVVTMISALIADIILLPALMMHVELVTAWDLLKMMPTPGGISPATVHELNQPLNAIKVGSDFLKMMVRQKGPLKATHLAAVSREISDQVARASQMIQRLGDMGQTPGFEKEPLQIQLPIDDTLAVMKNQLKLESIALDVRIEPNMPPIMGHRNRLVQVIYNLVDNAREAIAIQKQSNAPERDHVITINTFENNGSVMVTVADTGTGIADHFRDRIFEPFFTTKSAGKGKGLGLSISQQIIRDIGGRITVASQLGQGTTVTMTFPALKNAD
ncbi:MAG: MMPL family transporter [Desulfosarcina sp.]|nr:MMPL family transporter [Desulfosarcina sp.]MBC2744258.1 MMPL family transporter [Desulfosarcina sp.]MBC2767167.1 MMPL family transporter [Desulfosarcina sp.]